MSECLDVVESLSQREKNKILGVLQKDEKLRKGQEMKISLLKKEIQEIRMKGVLRAGDDQDKMCRRCRAELGFLFNRGALCQICRFKVCRTCQEFMFNGTWICVFCYKTRQLKWMTGEWATFQQNPLRKWASGSDILRASFQLRPGPSIDIDEPQQNGSNKQTSKTSRNGSAGGESARSRVDAPKDADQHKLSQLFDVLRPKKAEKVTTETQVRRVTSSRYHESDSESSSSSDVENRSGHSSPNALSVTESERDAFVIIESPGLSEAGSSRSIDSSRTSTSNEKVKERPTPSPRSPKPAPRKLRSDIVDPDRIVKPKSRPERKSEENKTNTHANLSVEDTSRVSMSRSVDTNLGNSDKTDIDRDRRAVSDAHLDTVRKTNEKIRQSREQLEREVSEELLVASQKPVDNESAILMNDSPVAERKTLDGKTEISVNDDNQTENQQIKTDMQNQDDDIRIQVPRGGSPYSISMDSLPSSHPSPTFHRGSIGGSSHADSSDTDSLSRMSHTEHAEFSGTESAKHGHDEEFVVEEISQIRFQRVSKKVGQIGVMSKLTKSPRTTSAVGLELEEGVTQEAYGNVGIIEGGGVLQESQNRSHSNIIGFNSLQKTREMLTNRLSDKNNDTYEEQVNEEDLVATNVSKPELLIPTANVNTRNLMEEKSYVFVSDVNLTDVDEKEVFEDEMVATKVVKPESTLRVLFDNRFNKARNKSADELSWYHEIETTDEPMKPHPRHSSLMSHLERTPSEADSIEGMIDDMVQEGQIRTAGEYGRQLSGVESEGSFCITPISPLPPEMFQTNKTATYRLAYNSDDNILDEESDDGEYMAGRRDEYAMNLIKGGNKGIIPTYLGDAKDRSASTGSLDLILHNQTELTSTDDCGLDYEVQEALKTKSYTVGKSNSSSLDSLDYIVEQELSRENIQEELDQEFSSTLENLRNLSADNNNQFKVSDTKRFEDVNQSETKDKTFHVEKKKLQKKDSFDILLESQPFCTENPNTDIDLDKEFEDLLEQNPREQTLIVSGIDDVDGILKKGVTVNLETQQKTNEVLGKDTFGDVADEKESNGMDRFGNESISPNHQYNNCKKDIREKAKLKPMSSLDILVDNQGDLIDNSEGKVELNEEFVAALEMEQDTKRIISEGDIDIQSEFTYLGIQQNVQDSLSKQNLYHYDTNVPTQDVKDENDHEIIFGEQKTTKPIKFAIRTIKSIPIGYLGQKSSEESSDSDLSVIEEETELDMDLSEARHGGADHSDEDLSTISQAGPDNARGIVMKQREAFEKQGKTGMKGNLTGLHPEPETRIKGKIFIKARDMESKVKNLNSSKASPHIAEKANVQHFSKLHDKFKKLQDHWTAVEHHEADILDLDDEDEDDVSEVASDLKEGTERFDTSKPLVDVSFSKFTKRPIDDTPKFGLDSTDGIGKPGNFEPTVEVSALKSSKELIDDKDCTTQLTLDSTDGRSQSENIKSSLEVSISGSPQESVGNANERDIINMPMSQSLHTNNASIPDIDGSSLCQSISDMSSNLTDFGNNSPLCDSIADRSFGNITEMAVDDTFGSQQEDLKMDTRQDLPVYHRISESKAEGLCRVSDDSEICDNVDEVMVLESKKQLQTAPHNTSHVFHESASLGSPDDDARDGLDNYDVTWKSGSSIPTIKVYTAKSSNTPDDADGDDIPAHQNLQATNTSITDIDGSSLCHSISDMSSNLTDFGNNSPLCESIADRSFGNTTEMVVDDTTGSQQEDLKMDTRQDLPVYHRTSESKAEGLYRVRRDDSEICDSVDEVMVMESKKQLQTAPRNTSHGFHESVRSPYDEARDGLDNSDVTWKSGSIIPIIKVSTAKSSNTPDDVDDDMPPHQSLQATNTNIPDIDGSSLCHSISDMSSNLTDFGNNSPLCASIADRSFVNITEMVVDDTTGSQQEDLKMDARVYHGISESKAEGLYRVSDDSEICDSVDKVMVLESKKQLQTAPCNTSYGIHESVSSLYDDTRYGLDNSDVTWKSGSVIPIIKVSTAKSSNTPDDADDDMPPHQSLQATNTNILDIDGSSLCHSISDMSSNLTDFGNNSPLCESIAVRSFGNTTEMVVDDTTASQQEDLKMDARQDLPVYHRTSESKAECLSRVRSDDSEICDSVDEIMVLEGKKQLQSFTNNTSHGFHESASLRSPDDDSRDSGSIIPTIKVSTAKSSNTPGDVDADDDIPAHQNLQATNTSTTDIDGSSLCHSISDMSSNITDFENSSPLCESIVDRSYVYLTDDHRDSARCNPETSEMDNHSLTIVGDKRELLRVCHSIPDGESELVYRVSEDSETCYSIDESMLLDVKKQLEAVPDNTSREYDESSRKCLDIPEYNSSVGIDSMDQTKKSEDMITNDLQDFEASFPKPSENVADFTDTKASVDLTDSTGPVVSEVKHIPLTRISAINKAATDNAQLPKTSSVFKSNLEIDLTESSANTSQSVDNSNTFKAPGTPSDGTSKSRTSSIQSSPVPSTSSSNEELGFYKSEKLASFQEAPQTISECSVSQDDSGNVSGGSRGATPEHRRTDSGYSQSSLPSTLSTVTDRSEEEEDIDRVIANIHSKGNRGNLLSVFSDSRESIASYYSDAGNIAYSTVPVTGDILFSVTYNYKTGMLEIGVKQCRDIAMADPKKKRSDPYVKTYLLPDRTRSGKRKTKIKKHTVNPTFDETLKYSISKSELENRTLWVTLWHSDRFGRNIFLGEVTINFDYYKFDDPSPRWYQLQERMDGQPSSMMVYKGDLSLCIRFVPADKLTPKGKGKQKKEATRGQLEVMVKEARNLTAVRSNGFSDPFCKGYLLPERHKSSKQKTTVIKKDCNPVWNHTLVFEDVSLMELRERCLELTIWDYEKLSSNDFLGGVRLNLGNGVSQGKPVEWMDARGEEMSMWQAMLDRPNLWIDGALILRPNMDKRQF